MKIRLAAAALLAASLPALAPASVAHAETAGVGGKITNHRYSDQCVPYTLQWRSNDPVITPGETSTLPVFSGCLGAGKSYGPITQDVDGFKTSVQCTTTRYNNWTGTYEVLSRSTWYKIVDGSWFTLRVDC